MENSQDVSLVNVISYTLMTSIDMYGQKSGVLWQL